MVPINLHQLYYFWIIAKSGSITGATGCLFLSQSTLSKQLKQLEASLGKRLLVRTRHGTALTPEGRLAFACCERMFPQAEELVALLRSGVGVVSPMVRLAVSRSIADDKVLALARFLKGQGRDVTVKVVTGTAEELKEAFRRRAADLVFSDTDLSDALGRDCRARLVASIPHYFVASAKLKDADFPGILGRRPLIVRPADNPVRKDVDHFLRSHRIAANILAELDNPDLILSMVLTGEGIGILDPSAVGHHIEHRRLVKLHARPIGIRESLWLLCGQQAHASAPVQALLDAAMTGFRPDARP
jgi:LysR family transcriptional activator of nhaA